MTAAEAGVAASGRYWSQSFEGFTAAGEIRYAVLVPKKVVAVFRDDALNATFSVASAPPRGNDEARIDLQEAEANAEFDLVLREILRL